MKYNKKHLIVVFLLALIFSYQTAYAKSNQPPRKMLFDEGWLFKHLGDKAGETFRAVSLPHDWSIEGPISVEEPSGNDMGYFPTGKGLYKKELKLGKAYEGKKIGLYVEGAYMNSEVHVNGQKAGGHRYGYSSYLCDITPFVRIGETNTIEISIDNSNQINSRWYTGSGLYRHVWLTATEKTHFAHWSTFVHGSDVTAASALVTVETEVKNESETTKNLRVACQLSSGQEASKDLALAPNETKKISFAMSVAQPRRWSCEDPYLYTARLQLFDQKTLLDETTETFGIRKIEYSAARGFLLNDEPLLLNGACVHHDNGLLGAASYDRAEEKKVELMKAAGFNALRCSHNIPSEAFLDACDRLGMLVIDEVFDGWREAKHKNDYSSIFDQDWQQDVQTMVLRDRNHPSIFCWSIGNEVIERKKIEVVTTAHKLAQEIKRHDPTRPITSALAAWDSDWEIYDPLAAQLDIVGYNYMIHKYKSDHERLPDRMMMQTESYPRDAFSNWCIAHDNAYVLGDFVWTGLDYQGESSIGRHYYEGEKGGEHYSGQHYPWHGAYCGDVDVTGLRKPISHYRSMLYNDNEKLYIAVPEPNEYKGKIHLTQWSTWPTRHSWNWPGWEGKDITVEVYSRYPRVQLYLNDQLIGEKPAGRDTEMKATFSLPYRPGTLKAVGLDSAGSVQEEQTLATADEPCAIRLTADRNALKANKEDLSYVTIEIVDKNGLPHPLADNEITVNVSGCGTLVALGSANMQDVEPYCDNHHKAWQGRLLAIIKATNKKGTITINATGDNLKGGRLKLNVR